MNEYTIVCNKEITKNEFGFKKKLIKEVQKHKPLYDPRNKGFSSVDVKMNAWQKIATTLEKDVEMCIGTWMDIRYNYQNFVRKLRKFLHSNNMSEKKRPVVEFERDLLFLWRFVADRSLCRTTSAFESKKDTTVPIAQTVGDKALSMPQLVINIEKNEENNGNGFVITPELRRLVELIKEYPEIYDMSHTYYNDYHRKGIIWNALSNELKVKATKLMKLWIYVQTRCEWEILRCAEITELKNLLDFLIPFIVITPNTIYKQSYYLKRKWREPLDDFKHIVKLLTTMHKFQNRILFAPENPSGKEYVKVWATIGTMKDFAESTPGQCEVTWLLMRKLYWELMEMRKYGYQLRDHWHFESIISYLYGYTKQVKVENATPIREQTTSNSYAYSIPIQPKMIVYLNPKALQSEPSLSTVIPASSPQSASISKGKPLNTFLGATPAQSLSTLIPVSASTSKASLLATPPIVSSTISTKIPIVSCSLVPDQLSRTLISTSSSTSPAYSTSISTSNKQISTALVSTKSLQSEQSGQMSSDKPIYKSVKEIQKHQKISICKLKSNVKVIAKPLSATTVQLPSLPSNAQFVSTFHLRIPSTSSTSKHVKPLVPVIPTSSAAIEPALPSISPLICNEKSPAVSVCAAPSTTSLPSRAALPSISSSKQKSPSALSKTDTPLESNQTDQVSTSTENMLYSNKMKIELVLGSGENLFIINSPTKNYILQMSRTALFIRYVMAIPQLHNKELTLADTTSYWEYLSNKFDLPRYVCIASWDFLLDNFKYFDRIAPIRELMRPFPHFPDMPVWKEGHELCKDLDKLAISKGWIKYIDKFPALLYEMLHIPELYLKNVVPQTILTKFAKIPNAAEICIAFKDLFISYMQDLEKGIACKWPQKWWRVLVQLSSLVHVRYNDQEPFYYIVKNKIYEEIERCTKVEQIREFNKRKNVASCNTREHYPNYFIADGNFDPYKLIMNVRQRPYIYLNCTKEEKLRAWQQVAAKMKMKVPDCHRVFRRALEQYLFLKKQDIGGRCRINNKYYQNLAYIYATSKRKRRTYCTEASRIVFPECFVPDINMDSCRTKLVMKNWCYAMQNLHVTTQKDMCGALKSLFLKFRKENCNVSEVKNYTI